MYCDVKKMGNSGTKIKTTTLEWLSKQSNTMNIENKKPSISAIIIILSLLQREVAFLNKYLKISLLSKYFSSSYPLVYIKRTSKLFQAF